MGVVAPGSQAAGRRFVVSRRCTRLRLFRGLCRTGSGCNLMRERLKVFARLSSVVQQDAGSAALQRASK